MAANSLKDVFKDDVKLIVRAVEKNINRARLVAYNSVKGDISRRVFQQGIASDGTQIGNYTVSTAKQRQRGGRQTAKVDLEWTGTLRRSLVVGTENDKVTMGFVENNEPKTSTKGGVVRVKGLSDFTTTENAIQQEKNFGKDIFAPTTEEIDKSQDIFVDELTDAINKELGQKTIRIRRT